jgi:hypothetical protein
MVGYGLYSTQQIRPMAEAVVDVLGGGEEAVLLLCETAAAETLYGTMPDPTEGAANGLCQCDELPCNDTVNRSSPVDIAAVKKVFDIDLHKVKWTDLRYSPLLSLIIARLHYKLKPGKIPSTLEGRAQYWKEHYNSVKGKGTVQGYIAKVKPWLTLIAPVIRGRV